MCFLILLDLTTVSYFVSLPVLDLLYTEGRNLYQSMPITHVHKPVHEKVREHVRETVHENVREMYVKTCVGKLFGQIDVSCTC